MKTAGRENPNHGATVPHKRARGAVSQNRSRSITWAAKQEKFRRKEMCFFLTSPFIELLGTQNGTESRMTHYFLVVHPSETGPDLADPAKTKALFAI
jgi:hypothetical protein